VEVMLLGAGRGTRLASLGLDVPKILVNVGGEPLLARQLRYLAAQGAERVVVNAHHMAEQVCAFADEHSGLPELVIVTEPELLGTAGGVRNAISHFGSGPIVVLYGDVLTTASLPTLMAAHAASGAAATITLYESIETEGKGTVQIDGERVVGFREKAATDRATTERALINAGLYVVEVGFITRLVPSGQAADFGHDTFPLALAGGISLAAYRLERTVLDIGTPDKLQEAQD
jgi:NDP-sugar pyrophosphorylase family protein